MAHLTGYFRLGRDAEVRYLPDGKPVANLSLAFNYGQKGQDGKRPAQWIDASLWGARAEKLAQYLKKGGTVYAVLSEPHIEEYQGRNGAGYKLAATVLDIELAGSAGQRTEAAPAAQQRPAPQQSAPAPRPAPADDFEDDIPF